MNRHLAPVVAAALALVATHASADLAETTIRIVGQPIQNVLHKDGEIPFFNETLPQLSNGKITAELVSQEQVGISGGEVMRMLSKGAIEYGSGGLTQAAANSPKFEGCDLPALTSTLVEEKAACEAYRPVLSATLEKDFNVKLLALGYNPPGAIWCSKPIAGMDDLKGKKVRIYNQALSDFVSGVGGVPLNIPYADTIPSLNSGVIDCAITGTLTGNTSKFFEVTTHLYPLSLGWGVQFWGVNLDTWNAYPDETKVFLEDAFKQLEARVFEIAQQAEAQGMDCNTGKDSCTIGIKANMTVVPIDEAANARRIEILQSSVLPGWAKRCGAACAEEWNVAMKDITTLRMPTN